MGLLDGLLGNASKVTVGSVQAELSEVLVPGEKVGAVFKLIRDLYAFTDKRLILIDKQGLTGKKIEYLSIPYKSVILFSVETAGTFDVDAELVIHYSGGSIKREFNKGTDILQIQRLLARMVLGYGPPTSRTNLESMSDPE